MKTIKFTDNDGITHNYNPKYVVDAYMTKYEVNNDWCLTILFSKDSGLTPNIRTKTYTSESTCKKNLDAILSAMESV